MIFRTSKDATKGILPRTKLRRMKSDNWSKRGQGIVLTWTRAYKYRGQTCDNTEDEGVTIPRTKPRPKEETEYSINQPIKHHTQIAVYS